MSKLINFRRLKVKQKLPPLMLYKSLLQLMKSIISSVVLLLCVTITFSVNCHYSCATSSCNTEDYYQCTSCGANRGNNGAPIYGMCYCSSDADEDQSGNCQASSSFNSRNKALILSFISITIVLSVFSIFVKGMKYFLYKTIEDVQELSLIVFINLYFPQQLDIFLTTLYRFNISSYTFQNIAMGSLFYVAPDSSIASTDGQNIYGKYRILKKTANFFSNQFTWMIVFFSIFVFAVIIRFLRNWLKKKQDYAIIKTKLNPQQGPSNLQFSHQQMSQVMSTGEIHELYEIEKVNKDEGKITFYWFINKLYNILWFNFLIIFFYFSLIEININVFTQISNLTFSSSFATTGTVFSAIFFAVEITVLILLMLKAKEEMIKPEWMRDYSFTPTIYLIRTNYKSITKYFWFFSCLKKILIALVITAYYEEPLNSIVAVSTIHALYLSLAIYCEPFERKYIRVHFYLTQAMKMFMFLSMVNFTTKYAYFVELIGLTIIFYALLAFIFGSHLFFLLVHLWLEWDVYKHFLFKKFCEKDHPEVKTEKIGYRTNNSVYVYVRQ